MALRILALLLLLGFIAPAPVRADDALTARLDAAVDHAQGFSGVIVVADHGKPVYSRALGYRNVEANTPMTLDALFELASISKQFTAMAAMMLHQEGKLGYDDPVEKYLPGLPYPGITVRHLLTHTSGIPDMYGVMEQHWDKAKIATNADIIAALKQYAPPRVSAPGDKYEYSNTGYVLLASVVEKAAGQDFSDFVRARIFRPLALKDTDIRSPQDWDRLERFALGYERDKATGKLARAVDLSKATYTVYLGARTGPGRVSSTAADLLVWDQALYGEKLIRQATLADAFKPMRLNDGSLSQYGFGWMLRSDPALGRIVHHSGGNPGYTNHIFRLTDRNTTVVILSNDAYEQSNALNEAILAAIKGPVGTGERGEK
jgi:CubicO group peptidase (beta-lactamase class C family)